MLYLFPTATIFKIILLCYYSHHLTDPNIASDSPYTHNTTLNQNYLRHKKPEKETEKTVQRAPPHTLPGRIGTGILDFFVKIPNLSSVTGV